MGSSSGPILQHAWLWKYMMPSSLQPLALSKWWQFLEVPQWHFTVPPNLLSPPCPPAWTRRQFNTHFCCDNFFGQQRKVLTFLSATPTVICDQLYKIIRDAWRAKKISFDGKPLSLVMLPTYHHMYIARHIVDFDDPVHRFSAFEQQDNVSMYPGTFLQWPQINYDIHLESTAGKKERERTNNNRWSGLRNVTVPLSGQLIKKLEVFPEKRMQTYAIHNR